LARARKDGAAIGICVCCKGDKGQPGKTVANLAAVRRKEMTASAKLLGAKLFLVGQPDGTLADLAGLRLKLVEIYRQFKPSLVLAHAPEDYHPDHRAASVLAEAASWFCASRGHSARSPAMEVSPALWWMDTMAMSSFSPGFYVDISEYVSLKTKMLECHQSQLSRGKDADFSPLGEVMRLQYRARGMQAGADAAEVFRVHNTFKRTRAW